MDRASFDEYVRRFNAEDPTAFDEFLAADVTVQNGGLLADIKVSYLSFIKTDLNGIQHSLGLVH